MQNHHQLENKVGKKYEKKDKRKSRKMKVSGRGVLRLKKIIMEKK